MSATMLAEKQLFLKYSTLFLITIQTSTMVLLLRYSRLNSIESGEAYFNSTAVFMSEFIKFIICIFVIVLKEPFTIGVLFRNEIFGNPKESVKIVIPAFLYTVQNNLLFLALSNLDAATYQVSYQFKILTTAFFSVTILFKRLSIRQWLSLLILMSGVILVQWPSNSTTPRNAAENKILGLIAVLISSFSSGFSGVYFEKLIKHSSQSLWTRNTQLSIISCIFAFFAILINDHENVNNKGFFYGYNYITWLVILLQAFGGICVSLVMKYADNILKGFATTISIIISSIFSYYVFDDFVPSYLFYIGTFFVVISTMFYSL